MNLMQLIDCFIDDVCEGRNETPTAYRNKLSTLARYLGAGRGEIDQSDIDGYRRWMLTRKKVLIFPR